MPELPEVESARRTVEDEALGRSVETVSVRPDGMTMEVSESTLRKALLGNRLTEARRHGKHLFIRSDEDRGRWLRLHFGMTGEVLVLEPGEDDGPRHVRLRLDLDGGRSFYFRCPRKLGRIGLVSSPEEYVEEKGLGPDVLADGFGLPEFREALGGRSGTVKSALMNQETLAGVGNEYSDEALFQAAVHPGSPAEALSGDDVKELWQTLRRVLRKAVEVRTEGRSVPSRWLVHHREDGAECPRCGGTVRKKQIAGRSSYVCEDHQRQRRK